MIYFNGIYSTELGVFVEKYPPRPVPKRKLQRFSVPGRSGDVLIVEDAFENVTQSYEIYLSAEKPGLPFAAAGVTRWLMQPGYCELSDEYDRESFRLAAFIGPVDLQNTLNQFGRATIKFDCQPQRWHRDALTLRAVASDTKLVNPSGHTALPLLRLFGSGAATLTLNGTTLTITVTDGMYLDCVEEEAWTETGGVVIDKNSAVSGTYPKLGAGENEISWTGGITAVQIAPRWYDL